MPENDNTPRYWAISGLGYGKGNTPGEAIENYVAAQKRNLPAKSTIYGTPKKWDEALRTGEAKADVWRAPDGATGFVLDPSLKWEIDGKYVSATRDQKMEG